MRNLVTSDLYKVSRILKKMGLKVDTNTLTGTGAEQVGMLVVIELVTKAIENLHLAEVEVNEFFASLLGTTPKKFSELPIEEVFEVITKLKEMPGISSFFKRAGQLTK